MNDIQIAIANPLVFSALLIIVQGTIIGLSRFYFVGTKKFSYTTLTPGVTQGPKWYASLNRIYVNAIESIAVFAPAVILCLIAGKNLEMLQTVTWVYLVGRLAYTVVYLAGGYTILCSFAWLIGFFATLAGWLLLLV
ncbi:MAG: MAPEG family protein [Bdellovibrionales bacterium]|nr:MAPEG family protein [Bdellovibrionales bacterium]